MAMRRHAGVGCGMVANDLAAFALIVAASFAACEERNGGAGSRPPDGGEGGCGGTRAARRFGHGGPGPDDLVQPVGGGGCLCLVGDPQPVRSRTAVRCRWRRPRRSAVSAAWRVPVHVHARTRAARRPRVLVLPVWLGAHAGGRARWGPSSPSVRRRPRSRSAASLRTTPPAFARGWRAPRKKLRCRTVQRLPPEPAAPGRISPHADESACRSRRVAGHCRCRGLRRATADEAPVAAVETTARARAVAAARAAASSRLPRPRTKRPDGGVTTEQRDRRSRDSGARTVCTSSASNASRPAVRRRRRWDPRSPRQPAVATRCGANPSWVGAFFRVQAKEPSVFVTPRRSGAAPRGRHPGRQVHQPAGAVGLRAVVARHPPARRRDRQRLCAVPGAQELQNEDRDPIVLATGRHAGVEPAASRSRSANAWTPAPERRRKTAATTPRNDPARSV